MKHYRDMAKDYFREVDISVRTEVFEEIYIKTNKQNKNLVSVASTAFKWALDKVQEHEIIITGGVDWHVDDFDQLGTVLIYVMDCGAGYYLEVDGWNPMLLEKHKWYSFNQTHRHRLYKSNYNVSKLCTLLVIGYK